MRCFVLGIRQFGGVCKTMCWSGRAGIYGMWPDDIYSIHVRIVLCRCASLNDDPSVVLGDAPALDERPGRAGGSRFILGSFVFLFYFWFWFPDPHQPARSLSPLESQCLYRLHSTAIALVLIRSALREIGLALCVLVVRLCALHTQKTTSRAEWMCLAAKYKEKRRKE
jgi:hypothetical protein